jgi:hypothetical protein
LLLLWLWVLCLGLLLKQLCSLLLLLLLLLLLVTSGCGSAEVTAWVAYQ